MKYGDPITTIDNLFFAKMVISHYYSQKGQYACFLPRVNEDCGNGCHVHLSLWRNGKNVLGEENGRYGLSDEGNNFIAGIFHHYRALT